MEYCAASKSPYLHGDGEKRIFEPGSVLLVEDTEGKGHQTKVIGQKDLFFVWVPILEMTTEN